MKEKENWKKKNKNDGQLPTVEETASTTVGGDEKQNESFG